MTEILTQKQKVVADEAVLLIRVLSGSMPPKRRNDLSRDLMTLCVDLNEMRTHLESALDQEDQRLREGGTDDVLDDRWIKNLRRLEIITTILADAEVAMSETEVAA